MNVATSYAADPSRRNILLLAICQGLAMTGTSMLVTVAALAGQMLAEDKRLATLPYALQFVVTMLATVPAALLMARIGRRAGFILGQLVGMTMAALGCYAIISGSFLLFCVSSGLFGIHNAFWQQYRFAAADTASDAFKSRAISLVLSGGIVAAVIGPELAKLTRNAVALEMFSGSYAAIAVVCFVTIGILSFIRIPRPTALERRETGRSLIDIARQPAFIVAVMSAMMGYGIMNLIMTSTPLAMAANHHPFNDSAFVIQWHILGMFVPSFFTGHLIRHFGVLNIIGTGAVLIFGCIGLNLSGVDVWNFWSALLFLGIGWNFMFIGGTTLLTDTYRSEEKAKVQALNDFLVFGTVAATALSSGIMLQTVGWRVVNLGVLPAIGVVLAAVLWLAFRRRSGVA